jgi:CHAD domain-containing protein
MPFQLQQAEPPERTLRRICRRQLGRARERLRHGSGATSIHDVRKAIKRVRATLRLVRPAAGRDANRQAAKALRRAAGCLAAARDARVMLRAFEKLAADQASRFSQLHEALRRHGRHETRRLRADENLQQAARWLRKARHRFDGYEIHADGWPAFAPGLRRSFEQGREMFRQVCRQPTAENFHRWRKCVKTLWYQLGLLCPAWPQTTRIFIARLERLGLWLGEEHDLTLLKQFVANSGIPAEREKLIPQIKTRREALRGVALELGAKIFSPAADVVCSRLEREWNDWRRRG